ncbi:MAG: hypothetical protein DRQ55_16615 [Planctomycetota bacterium]|nr:MAG: hypothetical protein DRQ55_16615 [Planctomycetota bacterium]
MSPAPVPVVHVITKLELGGAQQNTLHTVASLDRERYRPILVTGPGGMLDDEAKELPDVELHFLPRLVRPIHPPNDLAAAAALKALLSPLVAQGPCLVHTHSSKAGIVGRFAARRAGAGPVVHSIHGFGYGALSNPVTRRITLSTERHMARWTDAFVSVSQRNLEQGRALGLLRDVPARVIRSGIDLAAFGRADELRAEARASLGYSDEHTVVGMLACLKPQKAPLDFVALARRVADERDDARFFVAGDGELRPAMQRAIADAGLAERFSLLGWRRDVPALLGALDVAVLTSRWEGLPRVCPQAMAAGRPVVATAVDGTPEAIVDGRNGVLFAPGDSEAGARGVLRILGDAELSRRMAVAGREAVAEFDQELMVADQEALYAELLAAR